MKIKCIIIDDEELAISVIEAHLKSFENVEIFGSFTNPLKAFEIIESEKIDLIFLDINMPQINGLSFIETLNHKLKIVITTAYREYAVKSYELNVLDYLVKPIPFDRFLKTMNKVFQQIYLSNLSKEKSLLQEPHLFLKANKKLIKVNLKDIIYIESLKDYVKVVTSTGNYVVYKTITALTEELPSEIFIRIHRSYTISINKVKAINGNQVEFEGKTIPIGRNYIKQTKERILNLK